MGHSTVAVFRGCCRFVCYLEVPHLGASAWLVFIWFKQRNESEMTDLKFPTGILQVYERVCKYTRQTMIGQEYSEVVPECFLAGSTAKLCFG